MPQKSITTEIDLSNLRSEVQRISGEVALYAKVRDELIKTAQMNPRWHVDDLAAMVFSAFGVSEEFMDYYASEHRQSIRDLINTMPQEDPPKTPKPPKSKS